jgi:hypothetical protein
MDAISGVTTYKPQTTQAGAQVDSTYTPAGQMGEPDGMAIDPGRPQDQGDLTGLGKLLDVTV